MSNPPPSDTNSPNDGKATGPAGASYEAKLDRARELSRDKEAKGEAEAQEALHRARTARLTRWLIFATFFYGIAAWWPNVFGTITVIDMLIFAWQVLFGFAHAVIAVFACQGCDMLFYPAIS